MTSSPNSLVGGPATRAGERMLKLGEGVADELFQHRARSRFQGDDERVFCHPRTGHPLNPARYAKTLRAALRRAGVSAILSGPRTTCG